MTTTPPPDGDCAETVLAILDWVDHREVPDHVLSNAFELLTNRRRRLTLRVVRTYGDDLTLADLAEEVAMREFDRGIADISAETVREVYVSLYHDHLPRLVDVGLLEYEQERDLVSPGAL